MINVILIKKQSINDSEEISMDEWKCSLAHTNIDVIKTSVCATWLETSAESDSREKLRKFRRSIFSILNNQLKYDAKYSDILFSRTRASQGCTCS